MKYKLDENLGLSCAGPPLEAGHAVLRPPRRPSLRDLIALVETLRDALAEENIGGKLWTVQRGRVRIYQEEQPAIPRTRPSSTGAAS